MPSPTQGYSSFYKHIALSPELGNFRRLGANWAKKLHDDTSEVLACLRALEAKIKALPELDAKNVLDCPRRLVKELCAENPGKYGPVDMAWTEYDKALVQYGESLCLSQKIMTLPTQDEFCTKLMMQWQPPDFKPLFNQAEFVLTGERASTYQGDASRTDTCAWRAIPHGDILTKGFIRARPWIKRHILNRWRSQVHGVKAADIALEPSDMQYDYLVTAMDALACVAASVLLAVTIVVLVLVRPLRIRLALIGTFGTLFALLLKLMAGNPTRGEVFAATAAFYAVAAVFVGSMTNDCLGN